MKGRLERDVTAGVLSYLATRTDLYFWRANTGVARFGAAFVRYGIPGAPDIQGIQYPGRFVGIELKRENGGKVSEEQERWGSNCKAHGGLWVVATSIRDVEIALGPCLIQIPKLTRKRVYHRP